MSEPIQKQPRMENVTSTTDAAIQPNATNSPSLRIALFGSSMNPPTQSGHREIIAYFTSLFDAVWVLPVYQHMYSTKQNLAPYEDRVAMAGLALHGVGGVVVSRAERDLFASHEEANNDGAFSSSSLGTYDLLEYLRVKHPNVMFSLILGSDTYYDLVAGKWKHSEDILKNVDIHVVQRRGTETTSDTERSKRTFHVIPAVSDASSTKARACSQLQDLERFVGQQVASYIEKHKLYGLSS